MNMDRNVMTQKILNLTLEIIYLLTGEDHVVVKVHGGRTGDSSGCQVSEGPCMEPPPQSLTHDTKNNQKILNLTNQIIRLLTGEVPIRSEDVTVYLSNQEYVDRHKDLYKDVVMEDHQAVITLDKPVSGEFHTPVSLPGFQTNKGAGNMTNKCRGGQKTDTAMKAPAKSETHTVQESLAFEKRDVREEDTYPKSDHTLRVYPPTDIKEEPASSEMYSVAVGEASCTGDKLISTDYKRLSTHRSGHLRLQKVHAYQPFSCPEYRECFADRVALKIHQKIHMGEKPFISNCDLMSHQRNHTGEKPFKCNECGECFTWSTQLDSHKWVHSSEKPFGCSECGKRFSLKFILNQHLKIHTRDKPYKCTECGKCFTQSSNLARHKMIHRGEKPFNCTECGKRFTQASHLTRHKLTHTGEKPHKCPDCAECFTWPTQLDSHKWIHIGRKPFSCPECGKGFSLKSQFHRHLRSHTSEKLFKFSEYKSKL